MFKPYVLATSLLIAFAASQSHADAVSDGQTYFKTSCALCHDASPNKAAMQGPPLFGIVGRKVAGEPGFGYSDALKAYGTKGGKRWTAASLSTFLADPQKAVPGTFMPVSIPDAKTRNAVVAYLASLKGTAATAQTTSAKGGSTRSAPMVAATGASA